MAGDTVTIHNTIVNSNNVKKATGLFKGLTGDKPLDKFVGPVKPAK